MGVVMMTGIMAVVEMGLSLTGQSFLWKPDNPYQQNRLVGKRDQEILRLLHDHNPDDLSQKGQSGELCNYLLIAARNAEKYPNLDGLSESANDPGEFFSNSKACAFKAFFIPYDSRKSKMKHRFVVQPDPIPNLFSCVLKLNGPSTCEFESTTRNNSW